MSRWMDDNGPGSCSCGPTWPRRRAGYFCAGLLLLLLVTQVAAQSIPAKLEASILLRALAYDRDLTERCGSELLIGVLYNDASEESVARRDAMKSVFASMSGDSVKGLPILYQLIAVDEGGRWKLDVGRVEADVLYVCPGLDNAVETITGFARETGLVTMTGVEKYVRGGVAFGVGLADNKPKLLVNMAGAKAEGASLDPRLTMVAEVVD